MQLSPGLLASSAETKVGSRVEFSCEVAELSIVGAAAISCLHTGAWDHPVPACQHLNCPDILAVVKVSTGRYKWQRNFAVMKEIVKTTSKCR